MSTDRAKTADVDAALKRIAAAGKFPPWRGGDADRADVLKLWLGLLQSRNLDARGLHAAVDQWLSSEPAGANRWPSPTEVFAMAPRPAPSTRGADWCGRCNDVGLGEVAIHRKGPDGRPEVLCRMVHCDCPRGTHWSMQRGKAQGEGGTEEQRSLQMGEFVEAARNGELTVAVYPYPTMQQRGPNPRPISPAGQARLREILAGQQRANLARERGHHRRGKVTDGDQGGDEHHDSGYDE